MNNNILQYESKVWKTADLLIWAWIKQSDFPKFMMPFFALIMVESRLIRMADEIRWDFKEDEIEDFLEEVIDMNQGYNEFIIRKNKSLKDICRNDKTFDTDFYSYLKSFDIETKNLLWVDKWNEEEKFLNISWIAWLLNKKKILFDTVKAWSEIDLKPFSNSEITTLEEHIKRKWADISAETAWEQYTPDDVIALISEIIASKIEDNNKYLTIYDPTCWGWNMLYWVEDNINKNFKRPTATYWQDWNDSLYALAKIESRFREDSHIEYWNTLTDIKFIDKNFDVIVANPPYWVDWKWYEKDIRNDKTGRFKALPSVSDGQLLFTQHIISQLDNEWIALVVHNGSGLFSGDAWSWESEIRRYLFDNDLVEAIIQLPTDEFFNTNIFTYIWVFNKNKSSKRKNKFMMINAVDKFVLYDDVNYIKGGWINRNNILINHEKKLVTLSLVGAGSFKKINEIKVGKRSSKLLKTIQQAYSKAPYFKEVFPIVETVFENINNDSFISHIAGSSIAKVAEYLNVNTIIEYSSQNYNDTVDWGRSDRIIEICRRNTVDTYINASGGVNLYSKEYFAERRVELYFLQVRFKEYKQFNNNFISGLSIIDVLMFNPVETVNKMLEEYTLE